MFRTKTTKKMNLHFIIFPHVLPTGTFSLHYFPKERKYAYEITMRTVCVCVCVLVVH